MNPKNKYLAINIVSFDRVYHYRVSKKTLLIFLALSLAVFVIASTLAVIKSNQVINKEEALSRIGSALDEAKALNSQVIETSQNQIKRVTLDNEQRIRQIATEKGSLEQLVEEQSNVIEQQRLTNEELREELKKYKVLFSVPSGKPVSENVPIRSGYGLRKHPVYGTRKQHTGLDYKLKRGTPIRTTADGTVTFVGWQSGYGKTVVIEHEYGFSTLYAHLSKYAVKKGEAVRKGKVVAKSGNTGVSTGPHLHYEVKYNNKHTNPQPFTQWNADNYEKIKTQFKPLDWDKIENDVKQSLEKYALIDASLQPSPTH